MLIMVKRGMLQPDPIIMCTLIKAAFEMSLQDVRHALDRVVLMDTTLDNWL